MILYALIRVKNGEKYINRLFTQLSKIVNGLIVLDDGSTDGTVAACDSFQNSFSKYERYYQNAVFHGGRDWNFLHDAAGKYNPDWVIALDVDDLFEEAREMEVRSLLEQAPPNTRAFAFPYIFHWDSESMYRADGNYAKLVAVKACRYNKEWRPRNVAAHSGYAPPEVLGCDVLRSSSIRLRHFGYMDEKDRLEKYEFYKNRDADPMSVGAGSHSYNHIIENISIKLKEWESVPAGICMVAYNRLEMLQRTLGSLIQRNPEYFRINIVDNASDAPTVKFLKGFEQGNPGASVYYEANRYGAAKNYNKAFSLSHGKYLLHLESDIVVEKNGWIDELARVMDAHPELGILAPDYLMHHLRLNRGVYDEVDFCFSSDTQIPLLNGQIKTMKELSEQQDISTTYTYSLDRDGRIVPGKVLRAWKTGNRPLLKITLDNNKFFKCTPDHLVMMRDGIYKEAKDLKENDSVMPFYKQRGPQRKHQRYDRVYVPKYNKYIPIHLAIVGPKNARRNFMVVHHRDFDSLNNNPENLRVMKAMDHTKIHNNPLWNKEKMRSIREYWNKENRKRYLRKFKKFWKEHPFVIDKISHTVKINWKKYHKPKQKIRFCVNCDNCKKTLYRTKINIKQHRLHFCSNKCHAEHKKTGRTIPCHFCGRERYIHGYVLQRNKYFFCSMECCNKDDDYKKFRSDRNREKYHINHRIKKIETCEHEDTYDLTIDKYHNFAIDAGVFVHNCMGGVWMTRDKIFEQTGGWDESLQAGQFEVDFAYRVRMLGYRVGLLKGMIWTHLDDEYIKTLSDKQMDSRREPFNKGAFDFLRKWNLSHLGYFHYKSPFMMTWDDFPLNQMFRKQIFAQLRLNKETEKLSVQDHACEIVKNVVASGANREEDILRLTEKNRVLRGADKFENVPFDLLQGKAKWTPEADDAMDAKRDTKK